MGTFHPPKTNNVESAPNVKLKAKGKKKRHRKVEHKCLQSLTQVLALRRMGTILPCGDRSTSPDRLLNDCTIGTVGTSYFKWRRSASTLSVFGAACHWSRGVKNSEDIQSVTPPFRPSGWVRPMMTRLPSKTALLTAYQRPDLRALSFNSESPMSSSNGSDPISEGRAAGPSHPGPFLYPGPAHDLSLHLGPHTDCLWNSTVAMEPIDQRP